MRTDRLVVFCSLVIFALVVGIEIYKFPHKPTPIDISELPNIAGEIAASLYVDGYLPPNIDYDDPVFKQRVIFLISDVDYKQAYEIVSKLKFLDDAAPGKEINLFIDSGGGNGGDIIANFMATMKSPVNTYALNHCASGGAVALAAGTGTRYAFPTSAVMIHLVYSDTSDGEHPDFTEDSVLRYVNELFWEIHANLPPEIYRGIEGAEAWICLNAKQALQYGVVDEIYGVDEIIEHHGRQNDGGFMRISK